MIKLNRTTKPVQLTVDLQKKLTEEFKKTGKAVWNKDFLKKAFTIISEIYKKFDHQWPYYEKLLIHKKIS